MLASMASRSGFVRWIGAVWWEKEEGEADVLVERGAARRVGPAGAVER